MASIRHRLQPLNTKNATSRRVDCYYLAMPVHEQDPWRNQYFVKLTCPADIFIPTDDADAYRWNPLFRWVYNKLLIAESQEIDCAPHGIEPTHFPVFSKPIFNLKGMGVGSREICDSQSYERHCQPGHMWMTLLAGQHVSTDAAVIDGHVQWIRHSIGLPQAGGLFDYWIVEAQPRPELERYLGGWIQTWLRGYTGMLNIESIGEKIIEVHLRFADQWPDLYGGGWLAAMVEVYSQRRWALAHEDRRVGYSVVLFGPHARRYRHPPEYLTERIRALDGVSSLQITFHEDRPAGAHAMPPGGFRLAVINAWDLDAGLRARRELAQSFEVEGY
jgi:hypothetical protein